MYQPIKYEVPKYIEYMAVATDYQCHLYLYDIRFSISETVLSINNHFHDCNNKCHIFIKYSLNLFILYLEYN